MMKHFFLTACFLLLTLFVSAKTSRALFIGINQYKAPKDSVLKSPRALWNNLGGCVNDAEAMRDLAITRYGFIPVNITILLNAEASRARIIEEIRKLIRISEKGDVLFIFYAGHGSQMKNSLSVEKDKKDETIVPADAWKGVADIRDKELSAFFNELIDKGVLLTVIFDSCHSGSVGRGQLFDISNVRYMEENPSDAKDPSDPARPEDRGALIISAAQDDEFAKEVKDEHNLLHGAFTLALLKAFQQTSVDAPVEEVFNSALAIMKYFGKTQQPVLAGNEQRKSQTLFGLPKGTIKNRFSVPVSKINATGIELMGGYALGLSKNVTLKSLTGNDTIQITEMVGVNRSIAKIISKKKATIAPGTLFEAITWTSSSAPALKIFIPSESFTNDEILQTVKTIKGLRASNKFNLVNDLSKSTPGHIVYYSEKSWWYNDKKEGKKKLGATLAIPTDASAYINIPPGTGMTAEFKKLLGAYNNVVSTNDPEESQYTLTGTVNEKNELVYCFVKTNIGVEDTVGSLPSRTDYFVYDPAKGPEAVTDRLTESVFRIAKIRDWLMLQPPAGENKFPFELHIQHYRTGQLARDSVRLGDTLSFSLERKNTAETWNRRKRYIYVFSIDSKGAMKLLFPAGGSGNVENRLPITDNMNQPEKKSLLFHFLVKPPVGADNYFMLSSEEAIGNLSAFQQPGVISRGPSPTSVKSPLEALLFTGTKSRGPVTTPVTWSINKIVLNSVEKNNR
jgi:hypothetical protein